jgi:hypothetical protein
MALAVDCASSTTLPSREGETWKRTSAPETAQKLSVVLSRAEVLHFLGCVANIKHQAILTACYAAGLRISEAVRLKATSLDNQRMVIRIKQGNIAPKGCDLARKRQDGASLAEILRGLDLVIHGQGQRRQAPTPLLHLSTAYVCGERSGRVAEGELDVGQRFANGYESSKAEAERLVRAAQQQGGISAVARPSIVVGRYRDGTIGQFTNIYALIRLVTAGRIHVLPASPCASLDLVPIDHVIGGLTDIAEQMAAASGSTYHLVSGAPVPVAALRTLALGYQHLHVPRFVPPEIF